MDNRLEQDALIEDALKTLPESEIPKNITFDVMSRIQKTQRPQFITWNDFGLSLVIATCVASIWFTILNLPPILLAKMRIQGILLYQDFLVNTRWITPTLFLSLVGTLLVITLLYFQKRFKV